MKNRKLTLTHEFLKLISCLKYVYIPCVASPCITCMAMQLVNLYSMNTRDLFVLHLLPTDIFQMCLVKSKSNPQCGMIVLPQYVEFGTLNRLAVISWSYFCITFLWWLWDRSIYKWYNWFESVYSNISYNRILIVSGFLLCHCHEIPIFWLMWRKSIPSLARGSLKSLWGYAIPSPHTPWWQ